MVFQAKNSVQTTGEARVRCALTRELFDPLYANRHFWLNVDTTSYAGDGLWMADYVTAGKPRIKAKWRFHQYRDNPIDTNVGDFAGRAALREWAGSA